MFDSLHSRALTLLLSVPFALTGCSSSSGDDTGADTSASSQPLTSTLGSSDTGDTDPTTGEPGSDTTDATSTAPTSSATDTSAGPTTDPTTTTTGETDTSTGPGSDTGTTTDATTDTTTGGNGLWDSPNLWYSVDKNLIYVEIDPVDGGVVQLVHNELVSDVPLWHGQNGLTMLEDGTLLGSRESAMGTQIFHVPVPSTTAGTPAAAVFLGTVPGAKPGEKGPRVEALYTDCDGRIYLMDTGVDVGSVEGNRLLRFNGDYLGGVLTFDVITDLGKASVADIDDMSPGIVEGEITDGIGFAMDSGTLWQIDYTTGTGMNLAGTDGSWGVHALGGPLFKDGNPRLYILSSDAALMEVELGDFSSDAPLIVGPKLDIDGGYNGWSGLAGPLTECMTTIPG